MQQFLIQYLRKSKLACSPINSNKLGDYLNLVLKNIISSLEDKDSIDIYIRGSCWSKSEKTAGELIESVFRDLNKDKCKVYLYNKYPGYSAIETNKAFQNRNIKSQIASDKSDHSKEILIKKDKRILFYMVGSSNFSKNTYLKTPYINQSEVAFINLDQLTLKLIYQIILYSDNSAMLKKWLEVKDHHLDTLEAKLEKKPYLVNNDNLKKIFKNIITAPYIEENNEEDFFNNIYKEFTEGIKNNNINEQINF